MTARELRDVLEAVLPRLAAHEETLRELDAALGDGDLGITVRSGADAIVAKVAELPEEASIAEVLRIAGQAFATANPSTFAALLGGGLLAAAKAVPDAQILDRATVQTIVETVIARIMERGKAQVGDKTILDALIPSLEPLAAGVGSALEVAIAMRDVAEQRVAETAGLQSQRGRAAWVGERSVGEADPGATAYALFLGELVEHLADPDAPTAATASGTEPAATTEEVDA